MGESEDISKIELTVGESGGHGWRVKRSVRRDENRKKRYRAVWILKGLRVSGVQIQDLFTDADVDVC